MQFFREKSGDICRSMVSTTGIVVDSHAQYAYKERNRSGNKIYIYK